MAINLEVADLKGRIECALLVAAKYGSNCSAAHSQWVIDQMVQRLLADEQAYKQWVAEFAVGEDGPHTYRWSAGTAP